MNKLIILSLCLTMNAGCFLNRNTETSVGSQSEAPETDVLDVETGRPVYLPQIDTADDDGPIETCDVDTEVIELGPYSIDGNLTPVWATKRLSATASHHGVTYGADHLHVRSAWVSTASGSPVGSFFSGGSITIGGSPVLAWTPEISRDDYTIHFLIDGSEDLIQYLDNGEASVAAEARVRYPILNTYVSAEVTFDVWRNCTTR